MEKLTKVLGMTAIVILAILLKGFVFSKLWTWFVVPALNAPEIGVAASLGLMGIASLPLSGIASEKTKSYSDAIAKAIAGPLVALVMGWVIQLFM